MQETQEMWVPSLGWEDPLAQEVASRGHEESNMTARATYLFTDMAHVFLTFNQVI